MRRPQLPARQIIAEQIDSMRAEIAVLDDTTPQVNPFDDGDDYDDGFYIDPLCLAATPEDIRKADAVEVINVCRVIEMLFGDEFYASGRFMHVSFNVRDAAVRAYASEIGAAMYSAGRESFSSLAAQLTAVKAGLGKVIVEDLS